VKIIGKRRYPFLEQLEDRCLLSVTFNQFPIPSGTLGNTIIAGHGNRI
jgi:hypothetical protein